ncbi:MAG: hypothetical protein WBQ18_04120 [Solirubrobacteraceae bacterium]
MSEHDSFEDRLRAMAEEIGRSVQRFSEQDLDQLAESYGIDTERARTMADAASRWLNDRLSGGEPLFGQTPRHDRDSTPRPGADADAPPPMPNMDDQAATNPGPHPLDLPVGRQGLALSALDSGRWTVRPGSNQLAGTGEGPPPSDLPDMVSELRARDWITADGTLTLVGRHALARWCRAAEDSEGRPSA